MRSAEGGRGEPENGEADEPVEAPPRIHTRGQWFDDRFPRLLRIGTRVTRVTPSDDDASEASLRAPLGGAPAARSGTFARAMRVPLLAALVALSACAGGVAGDVPASSSAAFPGGASPPARDAISARARAPGRSPPRPRRASSGLDRAARAFEALPGRDCLLVVRDGALVHESYFGGAGRDARRDGRRRPPAVAALVGAGERANLFSLDAPLAAYGVDTARLFGATHGAVVTARHVLAQVHGGGVRPPGVAFARDDRPVFLNLLVELLEKTTGAPAAAFARAAVGEKIGAPNFFERFLTFGDDVSPGDAAGDARRRRSDISASGRYYATCGEMAKLAQIFLNLGEWPGGDRIARASSRSALGATFPHLDPARAFAGAWSNEGRGCRGVPRGGAEVGVAEEGARAAACGERPGALAEAFGDVPLRKAARRGPAEGRRRGLLAKSKSAPVWDFEDAEEEEAAEVDDELAEEEVEEEEEEDLRGESDAEADAESSASSRRRSRRRSRTRSKPPRRASGLAPAAPPRRAAPARAAVTPRASGVAAAPAPPRPLPRPPPSPRSRSSATGARSCSSSRARTPRSSPSGAPSRGARRAPSTSARRSAAAAAAAARGLRRRRAATTPRYSARSGPPRPPRWRKWSTERRRRRGRRRGSGSRSAAAWRRRFR